MNGMILYIVTVNGPAWQEIIGVATTQEKAIEVAAEREAEGLMDVEFIATLQMKADHYYPQT